MNHVIKFRGALKPNQIRTRARPRITLLDVVIIGACLLTIGAVVYKLVGPT